ncbi:FAS1-like dehydratase domain-containing protein [Mycolicibacterium sp.]|uniref:FAS1-like dehydratase domain-containing protein n=1 Tax=Mycolicibacterium sp. TaxID=2320850 RepID=UPI003D0E9090
MSELTTLVTPEMEALKGVWVDEEVSYPVSASDIRKWAIAVYWDKTPPRIFWDQEYAATTKWGGIIAPEDFNPFAWAVPDGSPPELAGALPGQEVEKGGNILNGGIVDTFGAKIRPGDVITSRTRLSHWEERTGRHGLTLYTYNEIEWRNQRDEHVKTRVLTLIRY